MKILVTGATGFIGKHVYAKLREQGYSVIGISKNGDQVNGILGVDIVKKEDLEKLFLNNRFDLIFHLAAYIPKADSKNYVEELFNCFNVNTLGTINLVEEGLKHKLGKLVFSSSASVYPEYPEKLPVSENEVCPRNFYGESKLLGEVYLGSLSRTHPFSCVSLRYSSVYGPGQSQRSVLPLFLGNAKKGGTLSVFGSGSRSQDFVYIDDVADVTIKAGLEGKCGVYNIGSGQETSMLELANGIVNVVGKGKVEISQEIGQDSRFYLDISRAVEELGYTPAYSLSMGLEVLFRADSG
ncbi:MAG: NAD-dependent epimerase/dehydratase family protein [Patescibacteria group bacterium]